MNLQAIETAILGIIGRGPYSDFSTETAFVNDFSLLHQCVNFARDEIRINCLIPAMLKHATSITPSTSVARNTISDTDFDIPVVVRYTQNSNTIYLKRANPNNLLDKISNLTDSEDPAVYQIFGATSVGLSYIEIYPVPKIAGTLDIDYKPVLTDVSATTDEDIIMKKYAMCVIQIASAYAFQMIIKDNANFDKWIIVGRAHFKGINLREIGSDNDPSIKPDPLLSQNRKGRYTI